MRFSRQERGRALEHAADTILDIAIIGGGITGAGVAREAALRGHSVALFEKGDFASGTSSRSSKLIHGGVRYLAQGDIALVREAARERAVLRSLAPHLARPVSMVIPASSKASRMKYAAGLWTFDKLAADPGERHQTLGRDDTLDLVPQLHKERLGGSVVFTEYVTHDSRLVLETLKAASASGAMVANYAPVTACTLGGPGVRLTVRDAESGASCEVRARCLINAAGPWFDSVFEMLEPGADSAVQLTRGIHLVVPRSRLPVDASVVLRSPDKRSTFVVPRDEYVYIGTTDTHYEGPAEEPGVCREDIDYLLASLAATFEDAPDASDVIGTWSGVRPLLRQEGKSPSEISRKDELRTGPGPVVSIAGGKLTTYRRMAERVVDSAQEVIGSPATRDPKSAETPLSGGSLDQQQRKRSRTESLADSALDDRLWRTYGLAAADIAERIRRNPDSADSVGELNCLTHAELHHAVESEMVLGVDDLLRRRSAVAMFDNDAAAAAAADAGAALAPLLGWNGERVERETSAFRELVRSELGVVHGKTNA